MVHEGLVELAARGLVTIRPRVGSVVSDYRSEGSLALLNSLLRFHRGRLDPRMVDSLLAMRLLIEVETCQLAAKHRGPEHLEALSSLLEEEARTAPADTERMTDLDFSFHHQRAMATDNLVYPMLLNSFKPVYTLLTSQFFADPDVAPLVFGLHREIVAAVEARDAEAAAETMRRLLDHGEARLRRQLAAPGEQPPFTDPTPPARRHP